MNSLSTSLARLTLRFSLDPFYAPKTADGTRKKSRCFQQTHVKTSYHPQKWPTGRCESCRTGLTQILAVFDIDHPRYVHGVDAPDQNGLDPASARMIRRKDPKSPLLHVADVELFGSFAGLHASAAGGCASCRVVRQRLLMVAAGELSTTGLLLDTDAPVRLVRQRFYREHGDTVGASHVLVKVGDVEAVLFAVVPVNLDKVSKEPDVHSYKHVAEVGSAAPAPLVLNCAGHGADTQEQAKCVADHVRSWLDVCLQTHRACRGTQLLMTDGQNRGRTGKVSRSQGRQSNSFLPTRLLAIESRDRAFSLRLVETADLKTLHNTTATYYTALSYSWGEREFDTTNAENVAQRRQGFEVSGLAKTFRDAVAVTYEAGIPYIWIDAFCIIQSDAADMNKELGLMHLVYSHAHFTIAAATAKSVQEGCVFDYPMRDFSAYPCRIDDLCGPKTTLEGPLWLNPAESDWRRMVAGSALTSRGWCFQERILSTRIVHCTTQGVFWECRELEAGDYYPGGKKYGSVQFDPRANEFKKLMRRDVRFKQGGADDHPYQLLDASIRHWKSLPEDEMLSHGWLVAVERFSHREFGRGARPKPEDKLPAILGLVKSLESRFAGQDQYLTGIWKSFVVEGLCWATHIQPGSHVDDGQLKKRILGRPSWSWASVQQPISFHVEEIRAQKRSAVTRHFPPVVFEKRVRVLSVDAEPTAQMPEAEKHDTTTITLKGRMIDLDGRYFQARHQRDVKTMGELNASFEVREDQELTAAPSQAGSNVFQISTEGEMKLDDIETSEWMREQPLNELRLQCLRVASEKRFPWSKRAEVNIYLIVVPVEGKGDHTCFKRIGRLRLWKPLWKRSRTGIPSYHHLDDGEGTLNDSDSQIDVVPAQAGDEHASHTAAQHTGAYASATTPVLEYNEKSQDNDKSVMIGISDWEADERGKLKKQSRYRPPRIEFLLPEDFIEPGRDVVIELV